MTDEINDRAQDERIGNMTRRELEALINQIMDQRMANQLWPGQRRDRPVKEVLESMHKNIIKPAPGDPSALDMLREDREQWYNDNDQ